MNRRHISILFLLGLLFAEGYAVAPVRPANDLRVAITIVCADPAVEIRETARCARQYPAAPADRPRDLRVPHQTPAFALFQRPPPATV